jgi:Papain-like cysteine protease AvrRpt2
VPAFFDYFRQILLQKWAATDWWPPAVFISGRSKATGKSLQGGARRNTMSLHYEVLGVELIRQDKTYSCWFASAMMVLNWKERFRPGTGNKSQAVDQTTIELYNKADTTGIFNPQIIPLAKRLGLVPVPPQSPTINGLAGWLHSYGPLWTNGTSHIVVIAGIPSLNNNNYQVKVYDPSPSMPGIQWRSLSGWYAGFDPSKRDAATRDTGNDVEAVFLHA